MKKERLHSRKLEKRLKTALNAAKETAADKDAAQTEVDNALNVLNAAVAKLEKVKDPNQQQPVQPQPEQTKPDKTTPQTGDTDKRSDFCLDAQFFREQVCSLHIADAEQ